MAISENNSNDIETQGTKSPSSTTPYIDRSTTPLKWHKFICYASLPFSALSLIGQISFDNYLWTSAIDTVRVVVIIATIIGLCKFRKWGYYLFFVNLAFTALILVLGAVFSGLTPETVGVAIGVCIFWIPTIIYYRKRRLLFADSQSAH